MSYYMSGNRIYRDTNPPAAARKVTAQEAAESLAQAFINGESVRGLAYARLPAEPRDDAIPAVEQLLREALRLRREG